MTILAGAVLLPDYARLAAARYERNCQAANVADLQAIIDAQDRLIRALAEDHVLNQRLATNHLGLLPANEMVVIDEDLPSSLPPGVVVPHAAPRPEPPSAWLGCVADRLARPNKRRGVLLLAIGCLIAAMFLFGSSRTSLGKVG